MAGKMVWTKNPHSGGVKIPASVQQRTKERIEAYARKHCAGKYVRLDVRFRGALCYIDAYTEPEKPDAQWLATRGETEQEYYERMRNSPLQLCRLRYFGDEEAWSFAFFAYSSMKYEPSRFPNGTFYGTPEEAFEAGSMYLQ
jgi:hypothetical protein